MNDTVDFPPAKSEHLNDQPNGAEISKEESENANSGNGNQEFSDLILEAGHKCMAFETLGGQVYLAKILKMKTSDDAAPNTASPESGGSSKKRRAPLFTKADRPSKKVVQAPPCSSLEAGIAAADQKDSSTMVFIHFEGWSSKHDRRAPPAVPTPPPPFTRTQLRPQIAVRRRSHTRTALPRSPHGKRTSTLRVWARANAIIPHEACCCTRCGARRSSQRTDGCTAAPSHGRGARRRTQNARPARLTASKQSLISSWKAR